MTCIIESPALLVEWRQLHDRIRSYQKAIAPQRKLPVEILAEVFQYCVTPDPQVLLYRPFTPELELVCSKWRRVALRTPILWTEVYVDYGNRSDRYHLVSKLAKERLSRSGNCLVSLTIKGGDQSFKTRHAAPDIVSKLVLPNAHRLRSLSVHATEALLLPFLTSTPPSIGSLQSIALSISGRSRLADDIAFFSRAVNLRHVTVLATSHLPLFRFPWAQLTDLHLSTSIHPDVALPLLRKCALLVRCKLHLGITGARTGDERSDNVVLENLLSLAIHLPNLEGVPYGQLIRSLILPRLDSFSVVYPHPTAPMNWTWQTTFLPIITLSNSVETLELSMKVLPGDIDFLFESIPSLVTVHLRGGDALAVGTLEKMSRGEILPKLEILSCHVVDRMDLFLDMLEWRWINRCPNPCTILRYAGIYATPRAFTLNSRTRVDSLKNQGMVIILPRKS